MSARPRLRLAGLILVLAGLFGMHGLGGHDAVAMGSATEAMAAEMPMGAVGSGGVMSAEFKQHTGPVGSHDLLDADAVLVPSHGGMGMGMTAMCVAILAAALVALVRRLLGSRVGSVLWVRARHPVFVLQPRRRDRDPPSLIALSIQRC